MITDTKVKVIKNSSDQNITIITSESNRGYIALSQGHWRTSKTQELQYFKRECYLFGYVQDLNSLLESDLVEKIGNELFIKGRICTHEYCENEIPEELIPMIKNSLVKYENLIKKKTTETARCKRNDQRIISYNFFDISEKLNDVIFDSSEYYFLESNVKIFDYKNAVEAVKIIPNSQGSLVTAFNTNNGKNGYIQLAQDFYNFSNPHKFTINQRTCLVRGETELLLRVVMTAQRDSQQNVYMPGRICIEEYLESEIPDNILEKIQNKRTGEYEGSIKREGAEGPEYLYNGDRIIRYSYYDRTLQKPDIIINHDNEDEIQEWLDCQNRYYKRKY